MNKQVLIITNSGDTHADIVASKIAKLGVSVFRVNFDEFPKLYQIAFEFIAGKWVGELSYIPTGEVLCLAEVGAVWIRKDAEFGFLCEDLAPQELAFANDEMRHLIYGLVYSLECYWMSHPIAIRSSNWKFDQLARAARLGFSVPPSVLTNSVMHARKFNHLTGNDMIFKTLSCSSLAVSKVETAHRVTGGTGTVRITGEYAEVMDAVTQLPCFFQKHIPKKYELRVTIIGNKVFAAKIHSQDDPRTATDYREFSAEILYESTQLPPHIERLCTEFLKSYNLNFGALDIIVTPDEEYVFLENNPAGQFLFIEELVPELDMTGAMANCLAQQAQANCVTDK